MYWEEPISVSFGFTTKIPPPAARRIKYPICHLIEGSSCFIPETRSNRISARLLPYRRKGWLFKTQRRREKGIEGIRVWRLRPEKPKPEPKEPPSIITKDMERMIARLEAAESIKRNTVNKFPRDPLEMINHPQ